MQSLLHTEANLLSRLERMPLSRPLLGIVSILAWCWILEAFDLGIIGQALVVLKQIWTLEPSQIGLLGVCSTAGVVIGTCFAGFLTDQFGRRRVLLWGVFVFTIFTLCGAAYQNLSWIVITRFLGGLGAGAVFPLPYLIISEVSPAKYRGLLVAVCNAILTAGYFLPTWCGKWAIDNFALETAWRVPFIVGGIPLISLPLIAKFLPESPRWLMQRGRHEEVRTLVETFERSVGVAPDPEYINPKVLAQVTALSDQATHRQSLLSWQAIFRPPLLKKTFVAWTMYTAGLIMWYVIMVYTPTILKTYGFDIGAAVIMTGYMMIIGTFGALAAGQLMDRIGRKWIWTLFSLTAAGTSYLLSTGMLSQSMVLILGSVTAFFGVGLLPVCKVYVAEQYPTELRGVGTGLGETTARVLGGVLATYYFAFFMSMGGLAAVFIFMSAAFIISVVALWIWGDETAGKTVEETSASNIA